MKSMHLNVALACILIASAAAWVLSQNNAQPAKAGTVQRIKIHGKALEGNLEGETAEPDATIYLPPGYETNRNSRYAAVRIGMKRPDVFSSMYILSACCLMNNPGAQAGGNRGAAPRGAAPRGAAPEGTRGQAPAIPPATGATAAPGTGRGDAARGAG